MLNLKQFNTWPNKRCVETIWRRGKMEEWDNIIKYEEVIYNQSKNEGMNDTIEIFKDGKITG